MERNKQYQLIINKLNQNIKFGLYERGRACYFDDGMHVGYNDLWSALRIMNNLELGHKKTLFELCPETYRGVFKNKFISVKIVRILFSVFSSVFNPKLPQDQSVKMAGNAL